MLNTKKNRFIKKGTKPVAMPAKRRRKVLSVRKVKAFIKISISNSLRKISVLIRSKSTYLTRIYTVINISLSLKILCLIRLAESTLKILFSVIISVRKALKKYLYRE